MDGVKDRMRQKMWRRWFAYKPVKTIDGQTIFLRWCYRMGVFDDEKDLRTPVRYVYML